MNNIVYSTTFPRTEQSNIIDEIILPPIPGVDSEFADYIPYQEQENTTANSFISQNIQQTGTTFALPQHYSSFSNQYAGLNFNTPVVSNYSQPILSTSVYQSYTAANMSLYSSYNRTNDPLSTEAYRYHETNNREKSPKPRYSSRHDKRCRDRHRDKHRRRRHRKRRSMSSSFRSSRHRSSRHRSSKHRSSRHHHSSRRRSSKHRSSYRKRDEKKKYKSVIQSYRNKKSSSSSSYYRRQDDKKTSDYKCRSMRSNSKTTTTRSFYSSQLTMQHKNYPPYYELYNGKQLNSIEYVPRSQKYKTNRSKSPSYYYTRQEKYPSYYECYKREKLKAFEYESRTKTYSTERLRYEKSYLFKSDDYHTKLKGCDEKTNSTKHNQRKYSYNHHFQYRRRDDKENIRDTFNTKTYQQKRPLVNGSSSYGKNYSIYRKIEVKSPSLSTISSTSFSVACLFLHRQKKRIRKDNNDTPSRTKVKKELSTKNNKVHKRTKNSQVNHYK